MTVKRPLSLTPQRVWWLASLLLPLASYAQDYTYDALNRLTTVTTTDRQVWSYHYDAAGNLLQVAANDTPPTPCLLYGVHDANRSDSQLFTVNPTQNFAVKRLWFFMTWKQGSKQQKLPGMGLRIRELGPAILAMLSS